MYADDKHLTYAYKDVNIIQSCLNKHLLNISRLTEFMLISSRQKLKTLTASPVLSINGTLVNQVSTSQSLGQYSLMQTLAGAVISKSWL